jgi:hypothetical protein
VSWFNTAGPTWLHIADDVVIDTGEQLARLPIADNSVTWFALAEDRVTRVAIADDPAVTWLASGAGGVV